MRSRLGILLLTALVFAAGCQKDPLVAPGSAPDLDAAADPERIALEILDGAAWPAVDEEGAAIALSPPPVGPNHMDHVIPVGRWMLTGDIAYYEWQVRTGPGPHDLIGLHRVVREERSGVPIRTNTSIFLLHGDIEDFRGMFLPGLASPRQPDDVGFGVHLALADIDVWGIGQAWTLVPEGTSDFSFMAEWGLQRQVDDLGLGIEIARVLRRMTGNGYRDMLLLGYSSGTATGFVYLGQEAQRPPGLRKVNGFIAADYGLVSEDPLWQQVCCDDVEWFESQFDQGIYHFSSPFPLFGPPALNDPDGGSELIPGLTNLQAAIGLGAWPGYPVEGFTYHFLAGIFDELGTPIGLQYTEVADWIDFMVYAPPYETLRFMYDYEGIVCSPELVSWDDHLADVEVPLLWVEAAGGAAPMARYTLDVVGSVDVTELVISLHPPEEILLDWAHIDLFLADNAVELAWDPMRRWVLEHSPR